MGPLEALLRYPLFALLGERALAVWLKDAEPMAVQIGQTLLEAGQPGEHVFVVLRGRVRVLRVSGERELGVGTYGPGEVFGEYALLPPHLNTATCRGREPAQVLRLPLGPVRGLLTRLDGVADYLKNWLRLHALTSHLRGGAFLGFLSAPGVLHLLDRCREANYPNGHAIQTDGLGEGRWFFVNAGEVLHGEGSQQKVLGPGSCFGERALLGRGRLPLVEARGTAMCLSLSTEDFGRPLGDGRAARLFQTAGLVAGPGERHRWLAQTGPIDCGVTALTMALWGHGLDVTRERVAAFTPLGENGASLQALSETAQRLGCRAAPVRINLDRLADVTLPVVAHLSDGHYVTLFERTAEGVVVGDPERGVQVRGLAELGRAWSGHLLLLAVRTVGDPR